MNYKCHRERKLSESKLNTYFYMSKQESRIRKWIQVGVHTHTRLADLLQDKRQESQESLLHDGRTSLEGFIAYARKFTGNPNVIICDTDHPVHVLDRHGISRKGSFSSSKIFETVSIMSEGVLQRAQIIRSFPDMGNVKTGAEVDIIDSKGSLDVNDSVLHKLDIVIGSLHYRYWKAVHDDVPPTSNDYLLSILNAVQNKNLDVLGHPTRELQDAHREQISIDDWGDIFDAMKSRNVAFEINLLYRSWVTGDRLTLEKKLIEFAAKKGVLFALGIDFHNFYEFKGAIGEEEVLDKNNMDQAFERNKGIPNIRLFRWVNKVLQEMSSLGVSRESVVNSSPEKFESWLSNKNKA